MLERCPHCASEVFFVSDMCPHCHRKRQDQPFDEKIQHEAVRELVRTAFPSRFARVAVGVEWTIKDSVVDDIRKAFLSGALGMSGPWLMAFGENSHSGILVAFEDGE